MGYVKRPRSIFYGWWLVGVVWLIMGIIVGPVFNGLGIFFVALERQFGWSRTALSFAFSLSRIEGALFGPIEGFVADRVGTRRMVLFGLAFLGIGLIYFSFLQTLITFYVAMLIVFGGAGVAGFVPLMAAINHWFRRRRATATALGLTGANLGGLLVPGLAWVVFRLGWRLAVRWLGIGILAIALPVAMMVRNRPEEYGLRPDGDPPQTQPIENPTGEALQTDDSDGSFTLRQAFRTGAFWTISTAHGLGATVYVTVSIHIIPALTDAGMSPELAGTVVAVYTTVAAIAMAISGFIGDRYPKRPLIVLFNCIQGLGMLIAAYARTFPLMMLFAVPFGIGQGMRVPLLVAIRGDYFGRKYFATIFGVSQLPMNLLMMGAPILAGYMFDNQGSYLIPFLGLALLNFIGGALMLATKKPELKPA